MVNGKIIKSGEGEKILWERKRGEIEEEDGIDRIVGVLGGEVEGRVIG